MKLINNIRPLVIFTEEAYTKMQKLVDYSKDEIAWHGFVQKSPKYANTYLVYDILVYPQYVTAATVDPDEEEYAKWLGEVMDKYNDEFNNMHFHGHSHVNMATTPSGTDRTFREELTVNLKKGDFYIFLITNKKEDINLEIYDKENDILFETKDIDWYVGDPEILVNSTTWAKEQITQNIKKEKKKCSTTSNPWNSSTRKNAPNKYTASELEQWAPPYANYWYGQE